MHVALLLVALFCSHAFGANAIPLIITASPINANCVVSRSSGVAPLGVFFDCSGTTDASVTSKPIHDIQYSFNFGDSGSGTWGDGTSGSPGTGSNTSRNTQVGGPEAAHIYETPGTYSACVTVYDGTNSPAQCNSIIVSNPNVVFAGTATICVARAALPVAGVAGCPSGAAVHQTSDFPTAIGYITTPGTRLLFNRGEIWAGAVDTNLSVNGPGIVGAYGTGAKPKIQPVFVNDGDGHSVLYFSSKTTPTFADWRFVDLEFDLSLLTQATNMTSWMENFGGAKQITWLRIYAHDYHGGGFGTPLLDHWNATGFPGHKIFDQMFLVDSTLSHGAGSLGNAAANGIYVEANRLGFLGNLVEDMVLVEHTVRSAYANNAIFGHNQLSGAAANKHNLKLHAGPWLGTGLTGGLYTQNVVISDNKLIGGLNAYIVAIRGEGGGDCAVDLACDERLRNIVVERNWMVAGADTQLALNIASDTSSVRDNVCDMTGAAFHQCVFVTKYQSAPAPSNMLVYNNTWYSASAGDFQGVELDSTVASAAIKNNLAYAPAASSPLLYVNGCGACLTQSNNSSNAQVGNTNPLFTSVSPFTPTNAKPTAGSYAIGSGVAVPVWSDFFLTPQTGTRSLGAIIP